jgi:hypothetical protein
VNADKAIIAMVPQRLRPKRLLSHQPLDQLDWISERPGRYKIGTIADLGPEVHLVALPTSGLVFLPWGRIRAKMSLLIAEPTPVHARYYRWLIGLQWRFHRILSREAGKHPLIRNMRFLQKAWNWVKNDAGLGKTKNRNLSIIASKQNKIEGHKLRHRMVDWLREKSIDADILGRAYTPIEDKVDGLAPYRYSLVIENTREDHYHTEKLIDALLCRTVPIYWGDPLVGEYFNVDGMIIVTSEAAMRDAVVAADEAGYEQRLAAIEDNVNRVRAMLDPDNVIKTFHDALES